MKRMGSAAALPVLVFCAVLARQPLPAMDWPVDTPSVRLGGNFGLNRQGEALLGIQFETSAYPQAGAAGELIYQSRDSSSIPSPLGNWMVLDHGDGMMSIYSRLAELPEERSSSYRAQGEPIAEPGVSGWSDRQGFYFSLFDRRERRWVNPSMVIGSLPDTQMPVIHRVELRSTAAEDDGRIELVSQRNVSIAQGSYAVIVQASDIRVAGAETGLAPQRISCSVNGIEIGALVFETYSARDGRLMLTRNGLSPVDRIYAAFPGYEVGESIFTRGQANLEVLVRDAAGNTRSALYRITVDPP